MNTPTQEYGWILIDTPEKKKQFAPKLTTDECFFLKSENANWELVGGNGDIKTFQSDHAYRRKIEPGEGWEIVPPDEYESFNMEYLEDGSWIENSSVATDSKTVGDICKKIPQILAFRRRKSVVKQSLTAENGGWISVKKRLPSEQQWVVYRDNRNHIYHEAACMQSPAWKDGTILAWFPIAEYKPKDPADVAFDEAFSKTKWDENLKKFSLEMFNAGREFERSKGQP